MQSYIYAVHETDTCVGLPEIFLFFYLKVTVSRLNLFLKMRQQNDSQSSH